MRTLKFLSFFRISASIYNVSILNVYVSCISCEKKNINIKTKPSTVTNLSREYLWSESLSGRSQHGNAAALNLRRQRFLLSGMSRRHSTDRRITLNRHL